MHDEARHKKKRMPHVHKDSGSNLLNNESNADVSVYCLQYHLSIVDKQPRFVLTTIWVSSYYFFEDSYSTIEKARNICSQEKMAYQQTRFKHIELQHCCSENHDSTWTQDDFLIVFERSCSKIANMITQKPSKCSNFTRYLEILLQTKRIWYLWSEPWLNLNTNINH